MSDNWISRSSTSENSWSSVCYGNGLFVAVATSGDIYKIMISPDGITWTSIKCENENSWSSVGYGNGLFVAVSTTGNGNRVMTSTDGITWTMRNSASNNNWTSVCYGDGLFVAVSRTGNGNRVMTSPDGITWKSVKSANENNWSSVCYGDDLFLAVSNTGNKNRVMTNSNPTCYLIGTKILCLIDDEEKYVEIENIKKGTLVKTYKQGYKKVELIGKKSYINNVNENYGCLYKMKDNNLTIIGGHYVLVDELPNNLIGDFYKLNLKIEDKFILLACDSELFEKINIVQKYILYHLVLESESHDSHFGIYAEGILSESTSKEYFISCNFVNTG